MQNLRDKIQSQFDLFRENTESLEQIVKDYPASSIARLLLAKKYKESGNQYFEEFKRQSALFVWNVPWFLFMLSDNNQMTDVLPAEGETEDSSETEVIEEREGVSYGEEPAEKMDDDEPVLQDTGDSDEKKEIAAMDLPVQPEDGESIVGSEESESQISAIDQAISEYIAAVSDKVQDEGNAGVTEENREVLLPAESQTEEMLLPEDSPQDAPLQRESETEDVLSPVNSRQEMPLPEENHDQRDDNPGRDVAVNSPGIVAEGNGSISVPGTEEEHVEKVVPESVSKESLSVSSEMRVKAGEFVQGKPAASGEGGEVTEGLEFDPLYTRDYFASQGIKLEENDLSDDRLSQQVRSFTGWLKSMKKLHPGKFPEQNEVIEKIIRDAAEMSNVGPNILTEAMAEVLVKQNKKDQAIEMYQKLSLMNPAKSAYFALKIEELKSY